ncbi:T9SS type A sorting domain-containing protein [Adhaeribacter radiodurans]|uniref:T9SS type A sorting domain-containing protein n=1 Tax=Adhaeribacter radiodurans TaxID=2745197 RepID=A0A7L7L3Z5_9BACT|nr:T9SS type A sorting domain-containing protein [Adhaeribacter radiodurans]QMU27541.1 T9SS type A sorting domain-containing protein [Adhaeribacter radiodurans]
MKIRVAQFKVFSKFLPSQIKGWRILGIILLIFFLNPPQGKAQVKLWDKIIGGKDNDVLKSAKETNDGNFILGGTSYSGKSGDKSEPNKGTSNGDYWIIKLRANGTKLWDKTFGGNDGDFLSSLQQTSDGGYILGGYSNSGISGDKSEAGKGSGDYWLVKLDADGNKIWDKTLGGNNDDRLTEVQQTSDGGYILGGYSNSNKSGDKSANNRRPVNENGYNQADYWVVKVDSTGNKVWDKTFGGENNDQLTALQQTSDGGYLLGGSSNSGKFADKSEPSKSDCINTDGEICYDYWIVKIDSNGKKLWDKTLGGYSDDIFSTMVATNDSGFLLGGTSESNKSFDKSEPSLDATEDEANGDYWIVKIKADGTKEWDKTYGGNKRDGLADVLVTADGGYLLGGYTNSNQSTDITEVRRDVESIWVLKINDKGEKIWDKAFSNVKQLVNNLTLDMALTSDGDCLIAGQAYTGIAEWEKSQAGKGAEDFWVIKLGIPDKKIQTISFSPTDQGLGNSPYTLSARASSGLPVTYQVLSGSATLQGNQLSFKGYGTIVVKAMQAGNATYSPVEYTASFQVQRFPKLQDKTFGGNQADLLADMVSTPDGGYLLAGTSSSGSTGDKSMASKGLSDFWLVKMDKDRKKLWDKSYGGAGRETMATIISTPDGGYLLGGSSSSGKEGDKSTVSKGNADYWLVKVDANGTKLWDKTIGGDLDDNLTVILPTPEGGYLLGGNSQSGKGGDKSENNKGKVGENGKYTADFWVVKIDGEGNKVWDKTFGGGYEDRLYSIIVTPNGNYLIGGESVIDSDQFSKYWIVKITPQGEQLWNKSYIYDVYNKLTSLITTPDGGYLLVGSSGQERFSYWIIKTDAEGNQLWDKFYRGEGVHSCTFCDTNESFPIDVLPIANGNYLVAGYSYSDKGDDRTEGNRGGQDYWLLEIDENGKKVADKIFGGGSSDFLTTLLALPNGGYLLGGNSYSNAGNEKSENSKGNQDFWLVQTQLSTFPPSTLEAWNLRYGGTGLDNFTTVIRTTDGGYLLGGYSYSNPSGDKTQISQGESDYWVVKTDASGNKLWDKRYGGTGHDFLNSIVATPDGGFLLGGSSESGKGGNKSVAGYGGKDFWIVKINSTGEKEWDRSYGGTGNEDLRKIKWVTANEYLLAGFSNSPVSGNKNQANRGGQDYWIIKVTIDDFNIYKMWEKCFGGAANDFLEDVSLLENDNLLLGGTSFSSISGNKSQSNQGGSDFWIIRTDNQGNKIWDKRYGGNDQDQLYSMLSINKDTILLAGQSASGKSGDKSQVSQGGKDFWLVQVDGKGEKLWDKTFGGTEDETLRSLIQDKNGGYILGGSSFSGKSGDKSQESQGSSDYWLVKTNNKGEKLLDKRYGGSQQEELRAMWITEDGGYLLGGRSNSDASGDRTQPSQGENDFWLVKVAPVTTTLIASREPAITENTEISSNGFSLQAYPNPLSSNTTIRFTSPKTQQVIIKLFDYQGRETATLFRGKAQAKQTYQIKWQPNNQRTGMYLLRLYSQYKNHTIKLLLTQ